MAQKFQAGADIFSTDPTITPEFMSLPPAEEGVPMPYSPEGWQARKLMPKGEEAGAAPAKPAEAAKKPSTGFTPEQAIALQRLVGVEQPRPPTGGRGGGAAGLAGRGQTGQMQQVQAGGVATAPRASLGQILYNGRKF